MRSRSEAASNPLRSHAGRELSVFLLATLLICMAPARAQAPSSRAIGQVRGSNIAIQGNAIAASENDRSGIPFSSGSVIIVHSGEAQIELDGGGTIELCRPAKLTILESGSAVTAALEFGRAHVELDGERPFRLYTPLIVATPLSISDAPRDMTLGLESQGALCVQAARGAVRLEQQFSGDSMIVPQPSEIFLDPATLSPTPSATGSCFCEYQEARTETAPAKLPPATNPTTTAAAPSAKKDEPPQPTLPPAKNSVPKPSSANKARAVPPVSNAPNEPKPKGAPSPETREPVWKVEMPALVFNTAAPEPPAEVDQETLQLFQEARVAPIWTFEISVEASAPPTRHDNQQVAPPKPRKKKGFWGRLRQFIFGKPSKS